MPRKSYDNLLPDDNKLFARVKMWGELCKKYSYEDCKEVKVKDIPYSDSDESDENPMTYVDAFEDNSVPDEDQDPDFDVRQTLNDTLQIVKKRENGWRRTGIDKALTTFDINTAEKVQNWMQNNDVYGNKSNRFFEHMRYIKNGMTAQEFNIQNHESSEDDSVNTAKYILSNRKKGRSTNFTTMTIKQFCYSNRNANCAGEMAVKNKFGIVNGFESMLHKIKAPAKLNESYAKSSCKKEQSNRSSQKFKKKLGTKRRNQNLSYSLDSSTDASEHSFANRLPKTKPKLISKYPYKTNLINKKKNNENIKNFAEENTRSYSESLHSDINFDANSIINSTEISNYRYKAGVKEKKNPYSFNQKYSSTSCTSDDSSFRLKNKKLSNVKKLHGKNVISDSDDSFGSYNPHKNQAKIIKSNRRSKCQLGESNRNKEIESDEHHSFDIETSTIESDSTNSRHKEKTNKANNKKLLSKPATKNQVKAKYMKTIVEESLTPIKNKLSDHMDRDQNKNRNIIIKNPKVKIKRIKVPITYSERKEYPVSECLQNQIVSSNACSQQNIESTKIISKRSGQQNKNENKFRKKKLNSKYELNDAILISSSNDTSGSTYLDHLSTTRTNKKSNLIEKKLESKSICSTSEEQIGEMFVSSDSDEIGLNKSTKLKSFHKQKTIGSNISSSKDTSGSRNLDHLSNTRTNKKSNLTEKKLESKSICSTSEEQIAEMFVSSDSDEIGLNKFTKLKSFHKQKTIGSNTSSSKDTSGSRNLDHLSNTRTNKKSNITEKKLESKLICSTSEEQIGEMFVSSDSDEIGLNKSTKLKSFHKQKTIGSNTSSSKDTSGSRNLDHLSNTRTNKKSNITEKKLESKSICSTSEEQIGEMFVSSDSDEIGLNKSSKLKSFHKQKTIGSNNVATKLKSDQNELALKTQKKSKIQEKQHSSDNKSNKSVIIKSENKKNLKKTVEIKKRKVSIKNTKLQVDDKFKDNKIVETPKSHNINLRRDISAKMSESNRSEKVENFVNSTEQRTEQSKTKQGNVDLTRRLSIESSRSGFSLGNKSSIFKKSFYSKEPHIVLYDPSQQDDITKNAKNGRIKINQAILQKKVGAELTTKFLDGKTSFERSFSDRATIIFILPETNVDQDTDSEIDDFERTPGLSQNKNGKIINILKYQDISESIGATC